MADDFTKLYFVDPSSNARRLLWHLLSVGSMSLDEPDRRKGFEKPGAHLFWVQSGQGTLEVPDRRSDLKPGPCCWWVDMSQPRLYTPSAGQRLVTTGFRFGSPDLEAWREALGHNSEFRFDQSDTLVALRRFHKQLHELAARRPAGYEWQIHLVLTQVLGLLLETRQVLAAPVAAIPAPVTRVINTVLADPLRDWKVEELAVLAGASGSSLRVLFKQAQHERVHEFLQRIRLDRARVLLCDRRLSIKEIAEQLHFSSEFYFSHFFRNGTGMSPSRFRRDLKA